MYLCSALPVVKLKAEGRRGNFRTVQWSLDLRMSLFCFLSFEALHLNHKNTTITQECNISTLTKSYELSEGNTFQDTQDVETTNKRQSISTILRN